MPDDSVAPQRRDIALWRGDDDPALVWEFGDADTPDILAGSSFVLVVQWLGGEIVRTSDAGDLVIDAAARTVTWPYRITETVALPRGAGAAYELRRLIAGKTRTWVHGAVAVGSGLPRPVGAGALPPAGDALDLRLAALRSAILAAVLPPLPSDAATRDYGLGLVAGVVTWVPKTGAA